jgi:hypothetical protein
MRFIVRWTCRMLILGLVLAVGLVLLKNVLLREWFEGTLRRRTGLECRLAGLDLRLLSPTLLLEGLRVYYPSELGGGQFLAAPEVYAEYEPAAVWQGVLRLRLLRVHVAELALVEDAAGRNGLGLLHRRWTNSLATATVGPFQFGGIDTVNLTLDRVSWLRLKARERPETMDLQVRNLRLTNVRTAAEFEAALNRDLTPIVLAQLTNRLATPRSPPTGRPRP